MPELSPIARIAIAQWGGMTVQPSRTLNLVALPAAPVQLLQNNPARVAFTVVNLSAGIQTVNWDSQAFDQSGIRLGPLGGFLSMDVREDGEKVGAELFFTGVYSNLFPIVFQIMETIVLSEVLNESR